MRALLTELPLIRLLTAFAATFPPRGEGFCPGLSYLNRFLQPHFHAACVQVFLQLPDAQQLLMEDARRQPGVDALVVE